MAAWASGLICQPAELSDSWGFSKRFAFIFAWQTLFWKITINLVLICFLMEQFDSIWSSLLRVKGPPWTSWSSRPPRATGSNWNTRTSGKRVVHFSDCHFFHIFLCFRHKVDSVYHLLVFFYLKFIQFIQNQREMMP